MTDNVIRFPGICDCLEMGPSLLKVEAVRVRFLRYSEEAVRQRPFSLPPAGVGRVLIKPSLPPNAPICPLSGVKQTQNGAVKKSRF